MLVINTGKTLLGTLLEIEFDRSHTKSGRKLKTRYLRFDQNTTKGVKIQQLQETLSKMNIRVLSLAESASLVQKYDPNQINLSVR